MKHFNSNVYWSNFTKPKVAWQVEIELFWKSFHNTNWWNINLLPTDFYLQKINCCWDENCMAGIFLVLTQSTLQWLLCPESFHFWSSMLSIRKKCSTVLLNWCSLYHRQRISLAEEKHNLPFWNWCCPSNKDGEDDSSVGRH